MYCSRALLLWANCGFLSWIVEWGISNARFVIGHICNWGSNTFNLGYWAETPSWKQECNLWHATPKFPPLLTNGYSCVQTLIPASSSTISDSESEHGSPVSAWTDGYLVKCHCFVLFNFDFRISSNPLIVCNGGRVSAFARKIKSVHSVPGHADSASTFQAYCWLAVGFLYLGIPRSAEAVMICGMGMGEVDGVRGKGYGSLQLDWSRGLFIFSRVLCGIDNSEFSISWFCTAWLGTPLTLLKLKWLRKLGRGGRLAWPLQLQ